MTSHFEQALTRDYQLQGLFRKTLFEYLDDGSLFQLRATSRTLRLQLEDAHGRLFAHLTAHFPMRDGDSALSLESVAQHCGHLTLVIGKSKPVVECRKGKPTLRRLSIPLVRSLFHGKRRRSVVSRASTVQPKRATKPMKVAPTHPEAREMDRKLWQFLLARFTSLNAVTIRSHGDPIWPGRTEIEEDLIVLRIVLERAQPSTLRKINLSPIHASGIIHLRWSAFAAFHETPSNPDLWQNITTLTLNLNNPSAAIPATGICQLSPAQNLMFLKLLHSYLKSFSPTLHVLSFTWLDAEGPSPLLLDQQEGMPPTTNPIHWPNLKDFWFGNITFPHQTIQLIPDRAPNVATVKALRSTHRFSQTDNSSAEAWIDIPFGRSNIRRGHPSYATSSIYSQRDVRNLYDLADNDDDDDGVDQSSSALNYVAFRPQSVYVPARKNWQRLTDSNGSLLLGDLHKGR